MEVIFKDENAMCFPSIMARYDPKCTVKTVKHSESVILEVALVETRTGEHETNKFQSNSSFRLFKLSDRGRDFYKATKAIKEGPDD